MSDKSKIEWTDATWNPVRGCSVVSEGCRNCYAMQIAARFSKPGMPFEGLAYRNGSGAHWTGKTRLIEERLEDPLRWKAPRRIFVNSMSDLFHESLTNEDIIRVFDVMRRCPQHTFQILTKRPARMKYFCSRLRFDGSGAGRMWIEPSDAHMSGYRLMGGNGASGMPWVWLGVSVEDQPSADERIWQLRSTPAAVRFVSYEPALGPVWNGGHCGGCGSHATVDGKCLCIGRGRVDWWIVGGESGPKGRPMHPDWARSLRDQCVAAGVPFFFKQWGQFAPLADHPDILSEENQYDIYRDRIKIRGVNRAGDRKMCAEDEGGEVVRLGKKAAGRLLDGVEWNQFPEAKAVTA